MQDHSERGWSDARGAPEARRKLTHLLAGDFMLYEVTADREMRILRPPAATRTLLALSALCWRYPHFAGVRRACWRYFASHDD